MEIDKLIAGQRAVNLAYVDKLAEQVGDQPTVNLLLDFCLSPRQTKEAVQHLELGPNVHVFSSPNRDFRFLGAFRKELTPDDVGYAIGGGLPAAAIIAFVGYGASSINGYRFADRIYLSNGFHRVYAMRRKGLTHVPMVIQQVNNWQLEFPANIGGMPRDYLLNTARPMLVKDFFVPAFVTTLQIRARVRMILFNIIPNVHDVPS